jgi:hypothetical protein
MYVRDFLFNLSPKVLGMLYLIKLNFRNQQIYDMSSKSHGV